MSNVIYPHVFAGPAAPVAPRPYGRTTALSATELSRRVGRLLLEAHPIDTDEGADEPPTR